LARPSVISLPSNVYFRSYPDLASDQEFIHAVSGKSELKAVKSALPKLARNKFTYEQQLELKEGTVCSLPGNLTGEQTHGLALAGGSAKWSCRCENAGCKHYKDCMSDKYAMRIERSGGVRGSLPASSLFEYPSLGISFDSMDDFLAFLHNPRTAAAGNAVKETVSEQTSTIRIHRSDINPQPQAPEPADEAQKPEADHKEFFSASEKTSDTAALEAKPSAEKEKAPAAPKPSGRRATSFANRPDTEEEKAASEAAPSAESQQLYPPFRRPVDAPFPSKYVAIEEEGFAALLPAAGNVAVEGASLALVWSRFQYLVEEAKIPPSQILLVCQSHAAKERILAKARNLGLDASGSFASYDNMPPLGGGISAMLACELESVPPAERERFLGYLKEATCPYMIISDRYMHAPSDTQYWDFYSRFDKLMEGKANLVRVSKAPNPFYEAIENSDSEAAAEAFGALSRMEAGTPKAGEKPVYLLANEEEAVAYSGKLWDESVRNAVLPLPKADAMPGRWIADMFWDIRTDEISLDDFGDLYEYRVSGDRQKAIEAFGALLGAYGRSGVLSLKRMADSPSRFPQNLIAESGYDAYVAYGQSAAPYRFSRAIIAYLPSSPEDMAYAGYMATGVGSGEAIAIPPMKRRNLYKGEGGRIFEMGKSGAVGAQIGLVGDVDDSVYTLANPRSSEVHAHIARFAKVGDELSLIARGGGISIEHEGVEVGKLSVAAAASLRAAGLGEQLKGAHISDIVTVMSPGAFRLGLRLAGFAS